MRVRAGSRFDSGVVSRPNRTERASLPAKYDVECVRDGETIWREKMDNVVCVDGLDYLLNVGFKSGVAISSWFLGLKGSGTASAAQTISGHAAWSEVVKYVSATRPTITFGTVASQSVDNSASVASLTASAAFSAHGCFVVSNSTKSGTVGTLYSVGDFSAIRTLAVNDILNVTVTLSTGQKA